MRLPARLTLSALSLFLIADACLAQNVGSPSARLGQTWPRAQFRDGSGSIALPPGWRLNSAQQASAELQGQRGEAVAVGITMAIGPAQFSQPGVLAGPYMLPPDAFAWVSEVVARRGGYSAQTRIVEGVATQPLTQNGRAAYLLADQMNHGRAYRSFALVNTAALGNGYWQYYVTLLTAPADIISAGAAAHDRDLAVLEHQPGRDESPDRPGDADDAGNKPHHAEHRGRAADDAMASEPDRDDVAGAMGHRGYDDRAAYGPVVPGD